MSVTFSGSNHNRMIPTDHGSHPARVYLHESFEEDFEDPRWMNLSCMNARTFLVFLGIEFGEDLYGEMPIPEIRRMILRARNTFDRRAPHFVRSPETIHGTPRSNPDGTVSLRPIRVWIGGIDKDYLARQLDRLEVLVEALAERGATHLRWG